jgi:flavin-dependent dehydrogenase
VDAGHVDTVETDVAVVGGGPAGAAAAIACAEAGLRVHLFEREMFAGERPGETLHPGIEPLFAQLGIDQRIACVVGARHQGVWVDWGGTRHFEAYGADADGAWQGFQVSRAAFDAMLLARARELSATVLQPCAVSGVQTLDRRIVGLETSAGRFSPRMLVDATGRSRWLARMLGVAAPPRSPRLVARYGYVEGSCPARDAAPALTGDASGWLWIAMVRPGVYQWTRVTAKGRRPEPDWIPEGLRGLTPLGPSRGADVTWRIAEPVACSNWFIVGDAAATLDPTSSHGVLKALLSGMTAGRLIAGVLRTAVPPAEAASVYQQWLSGWFANDALQLAGFYRRLGVPGFG